MTPGLIQRHHDYVLGPNQDKRLATVAAGQSIAGLALHMDTDAPFVLRSKAIREKYDVSQGSPLQLLNGLKARWSGPDRDYRSQNLIRQSLLGPYYGQLGNPIPVYPQVVYPRGSTLWVDIVNTGSNDLTNLTFYFRGVKLFAPGAVRSYEYPAQLSAFPYTYPQGTLGTDGLTLVRNVLVTQGPLRQTFKVKGDADFVIRSGSWRSLSGAGPVNEVFIQIRDEDEKPYSNDAVHLDVIFANMGMASLFLTNPTTAPFIVGTGPNSPGLFFPKIYVPKNHLLYFDITRADASYANAAAEDLSIAFNGQKVFQK